MNTNPARSTALELVNIVIGVAIASVGLKSFLLPNGFLDGGVTGIAILLKILFGFRMSVSLPLLSIPFLILAYFTVSKRIVYKSIISIALLAVALEFGHFEVVTEDKLLISIFGGLLLGLGIGITIRNGAVLDGSEVLGIFVNDRFGLTIGKVILGFNVILFSVTAMLLSMETAMYSTLAYLVTAQVTDSIIRGFEDFIGVTIVSEKSEEIQKAIIETLGAGMTIYKGRGGFGNKGQTNERLIIHTIVNRIDMRRLYRLLAEIDEAAFIVEFDVHSVQGGVLRRYLTRGKDAKASAAKVGH
ncbi:MAG: YitT family protein [Saprospiraceae bacterium]